MAIGYNILEIGEPGNPATPKKLSPWLVYGGEIMLENLAAGISHAPSFIEPDVYAVLQSLGARNSTQHPARVYRSLGHLRGIPFVRYLTFEKNR